MQFVCFLLLVLNSFNFRDDLGSESNYEVLAVIHYQGEMTNDGDGQGHYICDVKSKDSEEW